jgi:glycosyltransferase involved in cell wall biosynthesis
MSIIILGDLFTFPEGNAATNRVYTYAKAFTENNINVHIICFTNSHEGNVTGVVDGISYYYPFVREKRSKFFLTRRFQSLAKYFKTYSLVKKINKEDKTIAISRWTNSLSIHLFTWFLSKASRSKLIVESSEHPLRDYQAGTWNKMKGKFQFYIESKTCDGIFCISRYLINFHKDRNVKEKKLLLLPSTVDPSRFNKNGERPLTDFYIGYFGSLTFDRDSVDVLIKAFARISSSYPEVFLVLGGFCSEKQKKEIVDLIQELKVKSKVKVLDHLTREEVTKYITSADILVMVRSKNLESEASYPSKLTEFLATGRPVVSVNVGEISDYLSDGVNAFLVEPGDVNAMANKLQFIINNYPKAEQVGKKGKALAEGVFNYSYQSKRMIDFINSLS